MAKETVRTTKKRKTKGKRHPVYATALLEIADDLKDYSWAGSIMTPQDVLNRLSQVFEKHGKRVQGILR